MALPEFTDPVVLPAVQLAKAFADAALFTSADEDRPALERIELAVDGDGLILRSTDSYALIERRVEPDTLFPGLPDDRTVVGLIHRDEAALLTKLLKGEKGVEADIVPGHDSSISVRVSGRRIDTEPLKEPLTLPSFESLWPDALRATASVMLAGGQLTRLGKVSDAKAHGVRFELNGPVGAISWTVGEFTTGLVMPMGATRDKPDDEREDDA